MRRTPVLAVTLLVGTIACTAGRAPEPRGSTSAEITEADLRARLFLIADDSMMGRESGSHGNYQTAEYVAAEFKRLGLEPAGEDGSYFQTVPFWTAKVDPESHVAANGASLALGREFLPGQSFAPPTTFANTPTIYAGSVVDSAQWIPTAQVAGKVVVLDVPASASLRAMRVNPLRWKGAAGIALVVLDQLPAEFVATLRDGRPVPDTARIAGVLPTLYLSRAAASKLLGADAGSVRPGTAGAALSGRFDIVRIPVAYAARNVVAILRGSDPRLAGQYLSLTAHNDHVGFDHSPVDHDSLRAFNRVIRPMGADSPVRPPTAAEWTRIRSILDSLRKIRPARLDSIRNGADDDGSGTVALLEVAEALARTGQRPRRSILFVNHVGEEAGLLGSAWFTDHPTVPLDSIVAEIDQDMTGRGNADDFPINGTGAATPQYLEVVGAKRISKEFGDSLEAVNARQPIPFAFNYAFDAPGHPLQYYCRADHYNYARYGIPAVAFSRGEHLDYHQVTDEAQYINYPDFARVTRMIHAAALSIANMPTAPKRDTPKPANPHAQCRQ